MLQDTQAEILRKLEVLVSRQQPQQQEQQQQRQEKPPLWVNSQTVSELQRARLILPSDLQLSPAAISEIQAHSDKVFQRLALAHAVDLCVLVAARDLAAETKAVVDKSGKIIIQIAAAEEITPERKSLLVDEIASIFKTHADRIAVEKVERGSLQFVINAPSLFRGVWAMLAALVVGARVENEFVQQEGVFQPITLNVSPHTSPKLSKTKKLNAMTTSPPMMDENLLH